MGLFLPLLGWVSLNRYEQVLHDYIESLPEEKRFWRDRVIELEADHSRRETAALILNSELQDYLAERARHEPEFVGLEEKSSGKLSMLNLAEYWLRILAPAKTATKRRSDEPS